MEEALNQLQSLYGQLVHHSDSSSTPVLEEDARGDEKTKGIISLKQLLQSKAI